MAFYFTKHVHYIRNNWARPAEIEAKKSKRGKKNRRIGLLVSPTYFFWGVLAVLPAALTTSALHQAPKEKEARAIYIYGACGHFNL